VRRTLSNAHAEANREIFDYPGEYTQVGDGEEYVRTRIEELRAEYEQISGEGKTRGFFPGGLFTLTNNPREDQNREYLIVSAAHTLELDVYGSRSSGSGERGMVYDGSYTAIDSDVTYRSKRITPMPVVRGPQTAIVVGPAGNEIYTDEYGRVKVQFHWDRYGKSNENSSCWMRVSQPWAGQYWGAISIPRIGQEVIVDFLEGDPDRPIITGRVYNAKQMPPYRLPANATQSGVKSRSSEDGSHSNFNELRFEDKKGEEEVYFHAERDFNRVVENNDTLKVGFDDRNPGNQSIQIHNSQSVSIGGNQSETIGNNRKCTIEKGDDSLEVKTGKRTVTVKGDNELIVQNGQSRLRNETGNHYLRAVVGTVDVRAGDYVYIEGTDGVSVTSPDWVTVIGEANILLRSNSDITLRCGNSSITLTPTSIDIEATFVNIRGTPVKINC